MQDFNSVLELEHLNLSGVSGLTLRRGFLAGLYIAAIALVANTCYMITGAWLLVVGVFDEKSK